MQQTADHPIRSRAGTKLAAYGAVLALALGGGVVVGATLGPEPSDGGTATHGEDDQHGAEVATVGDVTVTVEGHLSVGVPSTLEVSVTGASTGDDTHGDGGHGPVARVVVIDPDGAALVATAADGASGTFVVEPARAGEHRLYVDVVDGDELVTAALTMEARS